MLIIRHALRWHIDKEQERRRDNDEVDLQEFIISSNILFQTWMTTYEKQTEERDWLQAWKKSCIADGVASYSVRLRSWYWRVLLYANAALLILIIAPIVFSMIGLTPTFPLTLTNDVDSIISIIPIFEVPVTIRGLSVIGMVLISMGSILTMYWRDYRQNKSFSRDAGFVTELQYLQYLVSRDSIRNPEYYEDGTPDNILMKELESFQDNLSRGDWSVFVRKWESIREIIVEDAKVYLNDLYYPTALLLWLDLAEKRGDIERVKRQVKWLLYFSKLKPSLGISSDVITKLSKYTDLNRVKLSDIKNFYTDLQQHIEWEERSDRRGEKIKSKLISKLEERLDKITSEILSNARISFNLKRMKS